MRVQIPPWAPNISTSSGSHPDESPVRIRTSGDEDGAEPRCMGCTPAPSNTHKVKRAGGRVRAPDGRRYFVRIDYRLDRCPLTAQGRVRFPVRIPEQTDWCGSIAVNAPGSYPDDRWFKSISHHQTLCNHSWLHLENDPYTGHTSVSPDPCTGGLRHREADEAGAACANHTDHGALV